MKNKPVRNGFIAAIIYVLTALYVIQGVELDLSERFLTAFLFFVVVGFTIGASSDLKL